MNLLSNAFKFTPTGGSIECILQIYNVHKTKIIIIDGGPGIPPKMRDTLFDRFFYIEEGSDLQFGDVSMGLAMVKDFAELHGGTVTFSEGAKGGAVFTVELPILAPPNVFVNSEISDMVYRREDMPSFMQKLTMPHAPVNESLRVNMADSLPVVLIIEDNIDVNQYISGVLSNAYRIENAYDGEEGLQKAMALNPDLIVSDILMPRMDGIQLVQKIRELPELDTTPIIILTAKLDESLAGKLLSAGAQEYLSKPFSHAELRTRVANLISLKHVKDDLKQTETELAMVTKELDELSYLVSHDLRSPLQSVTGFTSMLMEYYNFDPEVKEYLQHILSASKLMEELITNLLSFSQVMRTDIKLEKVNMSQIAKNILADLKERDTHRDVAIVVKDNVSVTGDRRMVELILENLLHNAWKHTAKSLHPRIEFGVVEASVPIYYVRDNGEGLSPAKIAKIFSPFSRLHPAAVLPGEGMGLSIVKCIVERHGGHLTVESEENVATTFYMTLEGEKRKMDENEV
jgi:signal transduction histidine kinase